MIRLIVNADDLGAGEETDRGIFEAFEKGIVTSASLIPNGPSFHSAIQGIRHNGLPVGVHLNLSEGKALGGRIPGVTDRFGFFRGKEALRRHLGEDAIDAQGLYEEMTRQVERFLESGVTPDHLDTHQHFFLFPAVTGLVLRLARSFGIGALRLPSPVEANFVPPVSLLGELALYRRLAPVATRALRDGRFFFPDGLLGMTLLNILDEMSLLTLLKGISPGTWELMVHPGHSDPLNPFSGPQRTREFNALTSPRVGRLVEALGIELVTFSSLSCAS